MTDTKPTCPVPNCHAGMLRDRNGRDDVSCPVCDGALTPDDWRALDRAHAPPVTMAEIDELRGEANQYLELARYSTGLARASMRTMLELKRERIEELLRRWWAQGCREVPAGGPVPEGPPYIVGSAPLVDVFPLKEARDRCEVCDGERVVRPLRYPMGVREELPEVPCPKCGRQEVRRG